MPDGQIFEEPRKGWRARLAGRLSRKLSLTTQTSVRRREQLSLTVPADKADALRAAVEQWLRGHGVSAAVTAEDVGNGKAKIRAKLDDADASKLDFSSDHVQSELQALLEAAVR
jgi:predicted GNAT family acetyltransferase